MAYAIAGECSGLVERRPAKEVRRHALSPPRDRGNFSIAVNEDRLPVVRV